MYNKEGSVHSVLMTLLKDFFLVMASDIILLKVLSTVFLLLVAASVMPLHLLELNFGQLHNVVLIWLSHLLWWIGLKLSCLNAKLL